AAFVEATFGFTLLRLQRGRLFVLDTTGRTPDFIREHFLHEDRRKLSKLLSGSSLLTTVSLENTDLGRRAVRARTLRAASIADVAPDLTDYTFICSVAEGYPPVAADEDKFRRYLGVSRARIRDSRGDEMTFAAYSNWLHEVDRILDSDFEPTPTLARYADATSEPADTTPRHVLLDIAGEDFDRKGTGTSRQQLVVHDYASEVRDGAMTLVVDGQAYCATVTWDEQRRRYHLSCPTLSELSYRETKPPHREVLRVVNAEQRMRVVPATEDFVYMNGAFVRSELPHKDLQRFWLLDVLTPVPALATATSEKGEPRTDDAWDSTSVFGLIDSIASQGVNGPAAVMANYLENTEMLLCTDLGTEIADFIAVQSDRIVMMHAKAGPGRKRSASALHEVVSQAVKNLLWLQPLNADTPAVGLWDKPWSADQRRKHTVQRLRSGEFEDTEAMWRCARSVITNPSADREVWLVLGGTLSKKALVEAIEKPTPELIQIYALLQSAWSAVSQTGARLRVFCSP
ncbi:hypothetical protein ACWFQT_11390, partial [Cellulosimicrobium cellulans]